MEECVQMTWIPSLQTEKNQQQQGNESGNVCDKVMYVPDRMETWVLWIIRQTKGHKSIKEISGNV